MNKPLNMIFIIPKNEAHFCVQCECFVNLNICPICYSDTLDMSSILDKNFTHPASVTCPACLKLTDIHDYNCVLNAMGQVLTPKEVKLYNEGSALESYAERYRDYER